MISYVSLHYDINNSLRFFLNSLAIAESPKFKYLGIHLDKNITWNEYIKFKRLLLNSRIKIIYGLINKKSSVIVNSKLLFYKSHLLSILRFNSHFFGTARQINNSSSLEFTNKGKNLQPFSQKLRKQLKILIMFTF